MPDCFKKMCTALMLQEWTWLKPKKGLSMEKPAYEQYCDVLNGFAVSCHGKVVPLSKGKPPEELPDSQEKLAQMFKNIKKSELCGQINLSKQSISNNIGLENGKPARYPFKEMKLLFGVNGMAFSIESEADFISEAPIVIRFDKTPANPIAIMKCELNDGEKYYARLDFFYGFFLMQSNDQTDEDEGSDSIYLVVISSDGSRPSIGSGTLYPDAEVAYVLFEILETFVIGEREKGGELCEISQPS